MESSGDWLDYLLFLLLDKGMPAGDLEKLVCQASSNFSRMQYTDASKSHWLVKKARELAWRIRIPGLTRVDERTLRRLDDALAGMCSTDREVIGDGIRAVQSLDDLGSVEANRIVHAWNQELQGKLLVPQPKKH